MAWQTARGPLLVGMIAFALTWALPARILLYVGVAAVYATLAGLFVLLFRIRRAVIQAEREYDQAVHVRQEAEAHLMYLKLMGVDAEVERQWRLQRSKH